MGKQLMQSTGVYREGGGKGRNVFRVVCTLWGLLLLLYLTLIPLRSGMYPPTQTLWGLLLLYLTLIPKYYICVSSFNIICH